LRRKIDGGIWSNFFIINCLPTALDSPFDSNVYILANVLISVSSYAVPAALLDHG
jgi:hypothetical protein